MIEALLLALSVGAIALLMWYVGKKTTPGIERSLGLFAYEDKGTVTRSGAPKLDARGDLHA